MLELLLVVNACWLGLRMWVDGQVYFFPFQCLLVSAEFCPVVIITLSQISIVYSSSTMHLTLCLLLKTLQFSYNIFWHIHHTQSIPVPFSPTSYSFWGNTENISYYFYFSIVSGLCCLASLETDACSSKCSTCQSWCN